MNLLVVPEGRLGHDLSAAGVGAKFHKGFVDAIAEIWEPLRDDVEARMKKADRPLWITGHSLVGAIGSQAVKGLLAGSLGVAKHLLTALGPEKAALSRIAHISFRTLIVLHRLSS